MKRDKSQSSNTKRELRKLDLRPSKNRGQNFVIDTTVIDKIVEFGDPRESELIVEIGPGLGALTAALVNRGLKAVVEIEPSFCAELQTRYAQLEVINQDARTLDFSHFKSGVTVFGNLPYIFSSEIVTHLIEQRVHIKRAVLLLQREFCVRMAAYPGGRDFGRLSVLCQLFANMRLGPIIAGDSFHPVTKVQSQLIELEFLSEPRVKLANPDFFFKVVKASFLRKRKKLSNSLKAAGIWTTPQIEIALASAEIDGGRRAEALQLEEFEKLATALSSANAE